MKISTEQVDLVKTRQQWPTEKVFRPRLVKKRKELENLNWTVLADQYINGVAPVWEYSHHDDYVSIPLFEYELPAQLNSALSACLPLGLTCAASLKKNIRRLHVVTGVPVEIVFDEEKNEDIGVRFWLGFAVVTE